MQTQAGFAHPLEDPALLEAVARAVASALAPAQLAPHGHGDDRDDLPALLSPLQAARLIGVSRQTIDRMTDAGDLPSVVLRKGSRQRMVRIPKAFVLAMLRHLNSGAGITLKDYTAQWLAAAPAAEAVPQPGEVA